MIPAEEILSAYLDDELGPQERLDVEHRLASDAQWLETFEKLKEVRGWIQDLPPVVPSRPKSISQMLAEDAGSGNEAQVHLNANSDLTAGPQSWKWLASLAAAAAVVVGSTLWWFSASVDQLAQGPNPQSSDVQSSDVQSSDVQSPSLAARENSTTDSAPESRATEVGDDQAILIDPMIASGRMPLTDDPAVSSPAIRTEDYQKSPNNALPRSRSVDANSIPSPSAEASLDRNMAGGFGGSLGSPASSGNPAAFGGSSSLSKRSNVPALGAAPSAVPGAAPSAPLESTATAQRLELSPVTIERFWTARENAENFAQYAVMQAAVMQAAAMQAPAMQAPAMQAPAMQPKASPESAVEELDRQQEQTGGLVGPVIHLKVPAEVLVDIEESLANGGLKLQPVKSSAVDSQSRVTKKEKASEASVAGQAPASGVWLLEISADVYESLRNRWSEKGFDISEILDDQKLQVVCLEPATDRNVDSGAKKGDEKLMLLLLQQDSR